MAESLRRTRRLKKDFDAAHAAGMNALKSGDYDALSKAIEAEEKVIDAFSRKQRKPPTNR